MRYFGSKSATVPALLNLVTQDRQSGTFCDPFGGIGTVGARFKEAGFDVYTGDQLRFARCFQVARIEYSRMPRLRRLCTAMQLSGPLDVFSYLNALTPTSGWFQTEFASRRLFFTPANAAHIDAIRRCIRGWWNSSLLSDRQRAYLIACLINSADRVANTAGTYYAHLKTLDRKAKADFTLHPIIPAIGMPGKSFLGDAIDLVSSRPFDILYLDPPYNERRYAGYYHLPEFIASHSHWRSLHGKSGIAPSAVRSAFNSKSTAADALRDLLNVSTFRLLVFHYSDNGLIRPQHACSILRSFGSVASHYVVSAGYTTQSVSRDVAHHVYVVKR